MSHSKMTLCQHFQELRKRLIFSILGILPLTILSFAYWKKIWSYLHLPLIELKHVSIINTHPTEAFVISLKIALLGGFILSFPWIVWNLWMFIAPGLKHSEQKMIIVILPSSFIFLLSGIFFAYLFIIPYGLDYLSHYSHESVQSHWTQKYYLQFVLQILFAFAITFQMPVIAFILAKLGLCTAKTLLKGIRFALPVIFLLSAILTPPDPTTQVLLALPLSLIYLLCILIIRIFNPSSPKSL